MKEKQSFFTGDQIETTRGDASLRAAKQACDELEQRLTELQEQTKNARDSGDAELWETLNDQVMLLRDELQEKRTDWLNLSRKFTYKKKAA